MFVIKLNLFLSFRENCKCYYAPFRRKGGILLCTCRSVGRSVGLSVCPSTRWLSDDNSRTLGPRIMKLHRNIDHDSQMRPIDFEVTWSKVKVTVTRNSKMVFE